MQLYGQPRVPIRLITGNLPGRFGLSSYGFSHDGHAVVEDVIVGQQVPGRERDLIEVRHVRLVAVVVRLQAAVMPVGEELQDGALALHHDDRVEERPAVGAARVVAALVQRPADVIVLLPDGVLDLTGLVAGVGAAGDQRERAAPGP